MKSEKYSNSNSKSVLTSMITDSSFLAKLNDNWNENLFASKWENLISFWCIESFRKTNQAPGKKIEVFFSKWASTTKDDSTIKLVEKFLTQLSEDYDDAEPHTTLMTDVASELFNKNRIEKSLEDARYFLDTGKIQQAVELFQSFKDIKLDLKSGYDPFIDRTLNRTIFEHPDEPLFRMKGALGQFLGDMFERAGLIAIQGPSGTGKSTWLLDIAIRALEHRLRTIIYQIGDMAEKQYHRRLLTRVSGHPRKAQTVRYPISFDGYTAEFEERIFKENMDETLANAALDRMLKNVIKSDQSYFKISNHPSGSLNANQLKTLIDNLANKGWVPDCVILDYADNLSPIRKREAERLEIGDTWQVFSDIRTTFDLCFITATQSDTDSFSVKTQTKKNFTGSRTKYDHCTGVIALNQTPEEKEQQIMRINCLKHRDGESVESKCVHVVGCPPLGRPVIKSILPKRK